MISLLLLSTSKLSSVRAPRFGLFLTVNPAVVSESYYGDLGGATRRLWRRSTASFAAAVLLGMARCGGGSSSWPPCSFLVYTEPIQISNALNEYFGDIGHVIGFDLTNVNAVNDIEDDLDINLPPVLCSDFELTNEQEITHIINVLNPNSAAGYDLLSSKLIKNVVMEIAPILTKLINKHITQGTFPDELKMARV